eukprot:m51a1_g604 hypothetical protein (409) ;mRNA; f:82450-83969
MNEKIVHLARTVGLGLCFFLVFVGFNGVQTLSSSVIEGALGFWPIATIYVFTALGCLFASAPVVRRLGKRYSLVVGAAAYVLYITANLVPSWMTLISAASVLGVASSVLWAAEGAFVSAAASAHARANGAPFEAASGLLSGAFFGIMQANMVMAPLMAALFLDDTDKSSTHRLFVLYSVTALVGVVGLFRLPQDEAAAREDVSADEPAVRPAASALSLLRDRHIRMLIPLLFFCGFEQGFTFGDFTGTVVRTALGVKAIGGIMAVYGTLNSVSSLVCGRLLSVVGPLVLLGLGSLALGVPALWILFGGPSSSVSLSVIAALIAFGDGALFGSLSNAVVGTSFADCPEAAFSNVRLWQSAGFACSFFLGPYVSLSGKIVLLMLCLGGGVWGFVQFAKFPRTPAAALLPH